MFQDFPKRQYPEGAARAKVKSMFGGPRGPMQGCPGRAAKTKMAAVVPGLSHKICPRKAFEVNWLQVEICQGAQQRGTLYQGCPSKPTE